MIRCLLPAEYEDAAELVARGVEIDRAADETDTDLDQLKDYTKAHAREWWGFVKTVRKRLLGQAGAEALTKLRFFIRSPDMKISLSACTCLMKFWMTTIRHGKGKADAPAFGPDDADLFDPVLCGFTKEEYVNHAAADWDNLYAKHHGKPPDEDDPLAGGRPRLGPNPPDAGGNSAIPGCSGGAGRENDTTLPEIETTSGAGHATGPAFVSTGGGCGRGGTDELARGGH